MFFLNRHIYNFEYVMFYILSLPLIQEEQLLVTGERMCTSIGKLPRRLAQEQCG